MVVVGGKKELTLEGTEHLPISSFPASWGQAGGFSDHPPPSQPLIPFLTFTQLSKHKNLTHSQNGSLKIYRTAPLVLAEDLDRGLIAVVYSALSFQCCWQTTWPTLKSFKRRKLKKTPNNKKNQTKKTLKKSQPKKCYQKHEVMEFGIDRIL